jgi:hypothetical protein
MKLLKKLAAATAVSFAMMGAAHADTVLNNWIFNPAGTGVSTGQQINEYLDITGNAFLQLQATSASTFNFTEHGVFSSVTADGNGNLFPLNYGGKLVTATFDAVGTGTFGVGFAFTGGTISIYSSDYGTYGNAAGSAAPGSIYGANLGTLIATFEIAAGGGGQVDATGSPINNGQVTVKAKATKPDGLESGYFFNADGTDLSTTDLLSFAFTNANTVGAPTNLQVQEIACQYSGYTGPGCGSGTYANTGTAFFVSNNGQFKLAEVPEPGSLALFGIAMLGAGVVSRKRAAKKAA